MPFLLAYWKHLAFASLLLVAGLWVYAQGGKSERVEKVKAQAALKAAGKELEAAAAAIRSSEDARKREAESAARAAAIASQYEQDKRNAEALASRLAADVRAGRILLQKHWTCGPAETGGASVEPDAAAEDRAASAARIVQAARDADAQIRGLQELIRSDRK